MRDGHHTAPINRRQDRERAAEEFGGPLCILRCARDKSQVAKPAYCVI